MTAVCTPTTDDLRHHVDRDLYGAGSFDRWLAAHDAQVRAEALEDFASRQFEMAQAWGHDAPWLTSGTKVAALVAAWAKEAAARIARSES